MNKPINLLLVDDDSIDREAVCRLLSSNYQVWQAATGQVALIQVQKVRPDCVLLDYRLPDVEGLALLTQFAQANLPVIVLTGEERPEIIVQAMQQGAQDYLVKKQLSALALDHAITNAIEKVRLQLAVAEQHQQLRTLAAALTLAEQQERRRIAQLLHDNIQQMLYGIKTRAHLLRLSPTAGPGVQEHLLALQRLADEVIQTTRTLTVELSPPMLQSEGLAAALQWLATYMQETHQLRVIFECQTEMPVPNADLRLLLFQIVRELLFNVVKHAGVQEAKLVLFEQDQQLMILVADEGRGFADEPTRQTSGGFGLFSIRERLALFGGQLVLEGQANGGVRATISVPPSPEIPI